MVLTVRVLWTCCSIVIPATREQGPITAKNSLKSITACCAGAGMADLCPSDDDGAETDPKFIKRGVSAIKRREYLAKYRQSQKYKDYQAAYRATDVGKSKAKKRNQDQKNKGNVSKYWKSPKGKALARKGYLKKKASPGKLLMLRIQVLVILPL